MPQKPRLLRKQSFSLIFYFYLFFAVGANLHGVVSVYSEPLYWELHNAKWSIRWADKICLKDLIDAHKTDFCGTGERFIDEVFRECLALAHEDSSVSIKNLIKSAKLLLKEGALYTGFIDELLKIESYKESFFVELLIKYGLDDASIIKKIVDDAIKNKKTDVLQVVIASEVKLKKSLRRKIKKNLKKQGAFVNHAQMIRELKKRFKKYRKSKNKEKIKDSKKVGDTQIESFLRVWFDKKGKVKNYNSLIKQLLKEEYCGKKGFIIIDESEVDAYAKLLQKMLDRERAFCDCYACYHAHNNGITFLFDLQSGIRRWFMLDNVTESKNPYLRFMSPVKEKTIEGFLNAKKKFFINYSPFPDNYEPLRSQVMAVNFVPFANIGTWGECTLRYFAHNKSISKPSSVIYTIFSDLGFDIDYIDKFHDLYDYYMTPKKGGNLLQIFIPKGKIDQFVYLSRVGGNKYNQKIFGIKNNDAVAEFFEKYVSNPWALETNWLAPKYFINNIQGRIVFMPHFYAPQTGVKIFRYNFVKRKKRAIYKKKFEQLIDQMMNDWIITGGYKKLKDDAVNQKLLRLLKYLEDKLEE